MANFIPPANGASQGNYFQAEIPKMAFFNTIRLGVDFFFKLNLLKSLCSQGIKQKKVFQTSQISPLTTNSFKERLKTKKRGEKMSKRVLLPNITILTNCL